MVKVWLLADHRSEYRSIQITQLKFQGHTEIRRQKDELLSLTFRFKIYNVRVDYSVYLAMGKAEIDHQEGKACRTTSLLREDPQDSRARQ